MLVLLISIEFWMAGFCTLLGVVFPQTLPWDVAVVGTIAVARWLSLRQPVQLKLIDWAILLLCLIGCLGLFVTITPAETTSQVLRLLNGVLFFYAALHWATARARWRILVLIYIFAGIALVLYGAISVNWRFDKLPVIPAQVYAFLPQLAADAVHRNVLAGSLVIVAPLSMAILLFAWRSVSIWERCICIIASLLSLIMLALTQSRGALLGFGAALLILAILRWRRGWLAIPAGVFIIFIPLLFWGTGPVWEALAPFISLEGLNGRLGIWASAVSVLKDFPLTGIGMGDYPQVVSLFYPPLEIYQVIPPHVHNLFLQVAVDLGIPGLLVWLSILILVFVSSWRIYQAGKIMPDRWVQASGAALLSSQVALCVHGMFDAVTWGMTRPAPLVWAIWGMAIAGGLLVRDKPILKGNYEHEPVI